MTVLTLYGRDAVNVFDLLGQDEDGMTYSLGWALKQSGPFLERFSSKIRLGGKPENLSVHLQRSRSGFGRTDMEIVSPGVGSVIVEAKRGYTLPTKRQLSKYISGASAKKGEKAKLKHLVVLTPYSEEVACQHSGAPTSLRGVPLKYLSWRSVIELAKRSMIDTRGLGRRVLEEFINYLQGLVTMQDRQSNMVYVVALSNDTFADGEITFKEVVENHQKYFHPVGNHYPTDPPNYLGFRYGGQLQTIHFVENVEVITQFGKHFSGTSSEKVDPHFLYTLGPAIRPTNTVRSGPIQNWPRSCMLDTLLTCDSVQDAFRETTRRLEEVS